MNKFKIGDKVRVRDVEAYTMTHGWMFTSAMREYIGKEFIIDGCRVGGVYKLDGLLYWLVEDWLEPAKPETIVIYRNGDKTIAFDKTTGKKAEAKCSKEDTYDFYTGARIAFARLIGEDKAKEESKLYNGKVVCIKSLIDLTKGKVYEFKDGYSQYDNGHRMPAYYDAVTSFEDLNQKIPDIFVELVED